MTVRRRAELGKKGENPDLHTKGDKQKKKYCKNDGGYFQLFKFNL